MNIMKGLIMYLNIRDKTRKDSERSANMGKSESITIFCTIHIIMD